MSDIKPASFRLDVTTTEKFKELANGLGLTQDKMLRDLMSSFELDNAKNNLGDRAKEIEEFQNHSQRMINIYLNSLELNQNSEARIKEQFSEKLLMKQDIISNLQNQLNANKEELKNNNLLLTNTLNDNGKLDDELKQLKDTLKTKESLISEYKNKIDTLTTLVTEYQEYKNKIDLVKAELEEAVKIKETANYSIQELKLENDTLNKNIDLLETSIIEYKNTISEIKLENKENLNEIKLEKKAALENQKDEISKITNELTKKNKELQENHDLKIEKIISEHENEISILINKYEDKINEISKRSKENLDMEVKIIKLDYEKLIFEKDKKLQNLKIQK